MVVVAVVRRARRGRRKVGGRWVDWERVGVVSAVVER